MTAKAPPLLFDVGLTSARRPSVGIAADNLPEPRQSQRHSSGLATVYDVQHHNARVAAALRGYALPSRHSSALSLSPFIDAAKDKKATAAVYSDARRACLTGSAKVWSSAELLANLDAFEKAGWPGCALMLFANRLKHNVRASRVTPGAYRCALLFAPNHDWAKDTLEWYNSNPSSFRYLLNHRCR